MLKVKKIFKRLELGLDPGKRTGIREQKGLNRKGFLEWDNGTKANARKRSMEKIKRSGPGWSGGSFEKN